MSYILHTNGCEKNKWRMTINTDVYILIVILSERAAHTINK